MTPCSQKCGILCSTGFIPICHISRLPGCFSCLKAPRKFSFTEKNTFCITNYRRNTDMNYDCNLIRDIAPLYKDNVLSPRGKEIVKTHLAACPACQKYSIQRTGTKLFFLFPISRNKRRTFLHRKNKKIPAATDLHVSGVPAAPAAHGDAPVWVSRNFGNFGSHGASASSGNSWNRSVLFLQYGTTTGKPPPVSCAAI